ncbi:MAG: cytidine deaminase [Bacteroidales bacterium]|jgi:cytidine deaminase|nr:cytidine deaminase [Bacteroidales bacterium]
MKKEEIQIVYQEYETLSELPPQERMLIEKAHEAAKNAYAPYSKYHVGAAILLKNGAIILGNNQENVAYPSGLCAERVAIFAASANYPKEEIKAVAITAIAKDSAIKSPPFPCGSCRQVLAEYENRQTTPIKYILSAASGKSIVMTGIENLLPFPFV